MLTILKLRPLYGACSHKLVRSMQLVLCLLVYCKVTSWYLIVGQNVVW